MTGAAGTENVNLGVQFFIGRAFPDDFFRRGELMVELLIGLLFCGDENKGIGLVCQSQFPHTILGNWVIGPFSPGFDLQVLVGGSS